jgi:hypothetical protein
MDGHCDGNPENHLLVEDEEVVPSLSQYKLAPLAPGSTITILGGSHEGISMIAEDGTIKDLP